MVTARRYLLDESCRRLEGGRVLLGGSPVRLFRLTTAGAAMIDRIVGGEAITANGLVDRLLDAGAIHPAVSARAGCTQRIVNDSSMPALSSEIPGQEVASARRIVNDSSTPASSDKFPGGEVTVVIPAWNTTVDHLVDQLVARPGPVARVIVVDDASPNPITVPDGAELVRRATNGGPGAARQSGLALVDTPYVAFVDADVTPTDGWLGPLLDHFVDERVALVAPRVIARSAAQRPSTLDRYEQATSPLDLGPTPGPVRARSRVSYVPSAAWLARTEALRAADGFDETMRVGEDVDLVWRLVEAGWRVRYEPASIVHHEPRATLPAWARQRAGYGNSAALLAQRHRGALAPVGVSAWSAASWSLAATGPLGVLAGATVAAGSALALTRKLSTLANPRRLALRLAGRGHLHAGRQLASAITRAWWPAAIVAALVSRRARRAVIAAAIVPALHDWWRRQPRLDPLRYVALRLADDMSYGWGLWRGVIAERTIDPLVPDLSSWPARSRYDQTLDRSPTASTKQAR